MNRKRSRIIRRVAVTLSGGGLEQVDIATAAEFAEQQTAEMAAVFIEDSDLLLAAKLPFTFELCRTTNVVRPLERSDLERQLGDRAEQAERAVAQQADQRGIKWSFQRVHESIHAAIVKFAREFDVIVVPATDAAVTRDRLTQPLTASKRREPATVVVTQQSPAGRRALDVAASIARLRGTRLVILLAGKTRPALDRYAEVIVRSELNENCEIHKLSRPDYDQIIAISRGAYPGTFIVPLNWIEHDRALVEYTQAALGCRVLIVS